uniref:Uncharacterized protein n=1 Tax=Opuntia streptacantha TaxID=393608 RepID=A0A7C9CVP0_OPUST
MTIFWDVLSTYCVRYNPHMPPNIQFLKSALTGNAQICARKMKLDTKERAHGSFNTQNMQRLTWIKSMVKSAQCRQALSVLSVGKPPPPPFSSSSFEDGAKTKRQLTQRNDTERTTLPIKSPRIIRLEE